MSGRRWASPADEAEQEEAVYKLWLRDLTHGEIARHLGLTVDQVRTRLDNARQRPRPEPLEQLRQAEADRLAELRRSAHAVKARPHVVVQGGRIVKDDDGVPLRDDGPTLKANRQLLEIGERWARLYGLNAPEKIELALEKRLDEESADIAEVLLKVIPEVLQAAGLNLGNQGLLTRHALELAGWYLRATDGGDAGPRPEVPRLSVAALPPGESDRTSDGPPPRRYREPDSADRLLAELARFEDEFGPLEGDDDE